MTVYFMRPIGMDGPVKVGNSRHPHQRLEAYNGIAPFALEIVATIPGDGGVERQFHALFAEHWSHHEWFLAGPVVTETIKSVQAGTFDVSTLPKSRRMGPHAPPTWTPERRRYMSVLLRFRAADKRGDLPAHLSSRAFGQYPKGREIDALEAFFNLEDAA